MPAVKKKPKKHRTPWTEEEDEFLLERVGTATYDWIAGRLGRTPQAVHERMRDLGTTDKYLLTGTMSARQLAGHLNVAPHYITELIRNHGLPAQERNTRYKRERQYPRFYILPEKFWEWANDNREKFNFYEMEEGSILPEPAWLEDQRRKDYYKKPKRRKWTPEEEERAYFLYRSGISVKEIAEIFKRTPTAIYQVLHRYQKQKRQSHD